MGVCINAICQDKAGSINVHRSIGLSSSVNDICKINKITPNYQIKNIGYKIKISLIFFCSDDSLKNSFTYKFQLFIDNSDIEEENFTLLGSTEATICQSKIKFQKNFETIYYFSKGQRIKICCLENEKNINTSMFYLGKMINGFENPKLIIEKDNYKIGELLILINRENSIKNKKSFFYIKIPNKSKLNGKEDYYFTINKNTNEIIYSSEIFNSDTQFNINTLEFYCEFRKFIIFDQAQYITFNLYKIKEADKINDLEQNNKAQEIKDSAKKENKIIKYENELVDTITISSQELINNNGINIFKMNHTKISIFSSGTISLEINYNEKDYTSFYEFISCQLRLNLVFLVKKEVLIKYDSSIKYIINIFLSIISLYNYDEQKFIYLKNKNIKKVTNYSDFYNDIIKDDNNNINNNNEIFPDINNLYNNYINLEKNKGNNKYFVILIFTDEKFSDLNSEKDYNSYINFSNYEEYSNSPINFKIFNFGKKHNYIEKNDININIFKNNENIIYNRILFQFYNVNNEKNDKKKYIKYLNDIPYLVEDFFEIQKSAKFTIFDD